jgi:hypothetical protein
MPEVNFLGVPHAHKLLSVFPNMQMPEDRQSSKRESQKKSKKEAEQPNDSTGNNY